MAGRLSDVAQHVPTRLADEAAHHSTQLGAEVLLAIGGGSATGLAKAVAPTQPLVTPISALPAPARPQGRMMGP